LTPSHKAFAWLAAEKIAEPILEDLFTQVLDWDKGDLDYQVEHADIVLTQNLVKYLVVKLSGRALLYGIDQRSKRR
jgi:hypothetical protein